MDDSAAGDAVARRYEQIVEAMGDGVYVLDSDTRYADVNEYLAELSGYDVDELIGARPEKLHDREDIARFERAIRDLVDREEPGVETVEATLETADGESVPIEVNLTLLPREDGEFRGTVGVVRDITERKERERELERYETLLELMPDTVSVVDMDGTQVELHGFEGWLGYDLDELIGEPLSVTMTEEGRERASEVVEELLQDDEREKATFEHELVSKDGERIPIESHLTLLPGDEEGRFAGTMSVLRDISERKERERELERQNERLQEFANVVSHDLRNPLNVAMGRLELIEEDEESGQIDEVRRALERIDAIVDDVLTLAREGETVEEPESVSLSIIAKGAWSSVRTPEATLTVEGDPTVEADGPRLQRLLENLFRNAIDHGGEDVTVRVGTFEPDAERSSLGIYVADDGPGIPADERETVFESGYTTVGQGTGFGLAIVQRIAEAHGWTVSVTESDDGGARFEIAGVEPG